MEEHDIFKAGVAPGSPTTQSEIKMLVCYILSKTDRSMSFAQLHEALAENALVNYFDLVAVLDELVRTGHLLCSRQEAAGEGYSLSKEGHNVAQEFTGALPAAVREKALDCAMRILHRQQRLSEVSFSAEPQPQGGYLLHFSIPGEDEGERLISFSVFAPSADERDLIRRRFLNDPLFLYKSVMALLTGSREVLGELLPRQDQLFE